MAHTFNPNTGKAEAGGSLSSGLVWFTRASSKATERETLSPVSEKIKKKKFMFVNAFACMCTTCMPGPMEDMGGTRFPRTGFTAGLSSHVVLGLKPRPSGEKQCS